MGYELIWDLVALGIILYLKPRLPPGMTYWIYLILYSSGHFLLSFLRLDPGRLVGLPSSQFVAMIAFYVAIFALVRLARTRPAGGSPRPGANSRPRGATQIGAQ